MAVASLGTGNVKARPGRLRLHPLRSRRPHPLAYSEIHNDEQGPTAAGFRRAQFLADHGIPGSK